MMDSHNAATAKPVSRGRGRPPGAKNKRTLARMAELSIHAPASPRLAASQPAAHQPFGRDPVQPSPAYQTAMQAINPVAPPTARQDQTHLEARLAALVAERDEVWRMIEIERAAHLQEAQRTSLLLQRLVEQNASDRAFYVAEIQRLMEGL